jgi:hypothetical protein
MPIADFLINAASGHKILCFLDGNAGYNQIFMASEDISKTPFICPDFVCLFVWVVMTVGLQNAGATYQMAMNLIFHDLLGIIVEVYIDDIVVKSAGDDSHIANLRLAFQKMCRYKLKMNPLKCSFGVLAGKFLGYIVHEKSIKIDPKKIEAIQNVKAPTCKMDVQKFLGKVNYLRRFVCNLSGKVNAFTPLLWLKNDVDFTWGAKQQEAFDEIKSYSTSAPILRAPKTGIPFKLYVAAEKDVTGGVLTQETEGREYIVAYESIRLLDAETWYTFIEKLCLSLYHTCTKLRHYFLTSACIVACQTHIIKYMLHKPILSGRVGKWAYALVEYDLHCEPLRSTKG